MTDLKAGKQFQHIELPKNTAEVFEDTYGIECAECPKCEAFIPNLKGKDLITCECGMKLKLIRGF